MLGVKTSEEAALRFARETELYTDFYVGGHERETEEISNPLLSDAAQSLLTWRKNIQTAFSEHSTREKTKYLHALEQAETEMQVRVCVCVFCFIFKRIFL